MDHDRRRTGSFRGRGTIVVVGVLYATLAVGWASDRLLAGDPVSNVVLVSGFIGGPGVALLYGNYRLSRTEIRPEYYPTVANWCLGGIGLLLVILALYEIEPTEGVTDPFQTVLVLTSFGSIAGFGVGVNDALAKTRAYELERRNQELRRIKDQLDETVAQLETANGELEASNERLEQFAYAASHDLQEPLRMVTSYLRLVEDRYAETLDEDGREFIAYAVDGADRMRGMIAGLLEYSRVETQGDPFEPIALEDVIADVRRDLEIQIAESGATIDVEPDALPRVEGDGNQLRQLFQNLLSNAIEYSGDEPPRIRIDAGRTGSYWTLSVSDDGIGIDSADADRIFEVFQRLHTREAYEGTGIGLALCKRIVERHDGEIRVDSEPGVGSTFSVTLPAVGRDA